VICLWSHAVLLIQQSKRRYIAAKHIINDNPYGESAQQTQPFSNKTASNLKVINLARRIDEFDEIDGLSHPLYKEGSSTDALA
jgi:hypothetical protein